MSLWEAMLLGVIQGLTEFLPISSTAHLLVTRELLQHPNPKDSFTTVVQLGTLVAVFIYFRREILALLKAIWHDAMVNELGSTPDSRLAYLIVLGSIPAGAVGYLFQKKIKEFFYNTPSMAVVAIVFALIMLISELWYRRQKSLTTQQDDITWKQAIWVGVWQMLALMPGASRSGCTISGGLFAGLNRAVAARFSFLISLPTILAAGLKDLYDEYKQFNTYQTAVDWLRAPHADEPPELIQRFQQEVEAGPGLFGSNDQMLALLVATVVSGVIGYLSIAWLLGFLRKYNMGLFVVYRLVLGATLLALVSKGLVK
jgi:undecaprenyl-diphosphatase